MLPTYLGLGEDQLGGLSGSLEPPIGKDWGSLGVEIAPAISGSLTHSVSSLLSSSAPVFALPVNSPMTKGDTKVRKNVGVPWGREDALWTPHGQSLGSCGKESGIEPKGSTAAAEPAQGMLAQEDIKDLLLLLLPGYSGFPRGPCLIHWVLGPGTLV